MLIGWLRIDTLFDWHPNCHWTITSNRKSRMFSLVFLIFVLNTDSLSPFHPADPSLSEAVQYCSSRQRQHPPGHWRWSHGSLACRSLRPHTDAGQRPVCFGQRERLSTHHLAVRDDPFSSLLPSVVVGLWSLKLILPVCICKCRGLSFCFNWAWWLVHFLQGSIEAKGASRPSLLMLIGTCCSPLTPKM